MDSDQNTKFFQACATQCQKKNYISRIFNEANQEFTVEVDVLAGLKKYFQHLFTSSWPREAKVTQRTNLIASKVLDDMNRSLSREYTREEVEDALKLMALLKSLGPDGFGASFYQKHWNVVEDDKIVSSKVMVRLLSLNSTFIALIPKKFNPIVVNEF